MNVLIFVVTMLMLLAILTYGRLETFRTNQGYELLFTHYMEESERGYINLSAKKKYDSVTFPTQNSSSGKTRVAATPRISIRFLTDAQQRAIHQGEADKLSTMLKKLIYNLYGQQSFYKEIEQKRPGFLNEIMTHIERAAEALPKNKKVAKTLDLANLDLRDKELNDAFYLMLKGAPVLSSNKASAKNKPLPKIEEQPEAEKDSDAVEQALASLESEEYKSPKGYHSLLDFITISPSPKVRVYLAPREVLKAIFNEDAVVDEIFKTRNNLYKSVKGKEGDTSQATETFKNAFENRRDPNFDESVLDFSVSKTNPKRYE